MHITNADIVVIITTIRNVLCSVRQKQLRKCRIKGIKSIGYNDANSNVVPTAVHITYITFR